MSFLAPAGSRRGFVDWTELMLKDHGFLRLYWHNEHQIAPNIWRCNQPSPSRIKRAADRGILVMLACHRLTPQAWPGTGLWYDDNIDEEA